ncbi:myb family transcription factor PHL8-like isoform X4 [Ananas comosus]|uniref:Myb family transcription factor PHL8-like isoform X4 n=1 Tax=Ananas comosus TaxID=4615 RepID=A0A6P5F5J4_ANACO|nr:myb family transcription factor PHL8-like isoform X4 [Ananas comosus]
MYGLSVFQGQQHKGSTSHNSYICWRGDDSQLPLRRKCPTITAIRGWFYQPTPSRALNGLNSFTTDSSMRSLGLAEQTVMGVPGLTLYHLKSHLQKYRLAKSRDTNILHDYSEGEIQCKILERSTPDADENKAQNQLDETMLQMQMQVQRKLQEQIEVQRHLQLRIEAQGKYLQNVLRKAQETLSAYSSNSIGTDVRSRIRPPRSHAESVLALLHVMGAKSFNLGGSITTAGKQLELREAEAASVEKPLWMSTQPGRGFSIRKSAVLRSQKNLISTGNHQLGEFIV